MNEVILTGRLTRDPEQHGRGVKFTLAVDRFSGGEKSADFIGCTAFGKTGELIMQYIQKGSKILVDGKISTGSYTKNDGAKVYTTDVIVNRVEFLESKKNLTQDNTTAVAGSDSFMDIPDDLGDTLPFN